LNIRYTSIHGIEREREREREGERGSEMEIEVGWGEGERPRRRRVYWMHTGEEYGGVTIGYTPYF